MDKIISKVEDFINILRGKISEMARAANFNMRDSGKLEALTFAMAMTIGVLKEHEITLNILVNFCREYQGQELEMTKQAMRERMDKGELLMNKLFEMVLNETKSKFCSLENIEVLKQFTDVEITDATTVSLVKKLAGLYKGLGGTNAEAAFKMQTTYSVFKRAFSDLKVYASSANDTDYNDETLKDLVPGVLYIRDLGYFEKEYFAELDKANAFFLSRIKTNCILYKLCESTGVYQKLDWKDVLKPKMNTIDTKVYIRLKTGEMRDVRLVGVKLPEDKINERKRKANKKLEAKGQCMTEREKLTIEWNLMITNVTSDMLDTDAIYELYRLRWTIELIFKGLKGSLDFDKMGTAGGSYFMCLLYGKMIVSMITINIYALCNIAMFHRNKRQVSIQGFLRNFRSISSYFFNAVLENTEDDWNKLEVELLHISKKCLYEIRKRKTTEQRLEGKDLPLAVLKVLQGNVIHN